MTHLAVGEWAKIPVLTSMGNGGFTRTQANALISAARQHPLGGADGSGIVSDRHTHLRVGQFVGVIAAGGCSLEILPKIDPQGADNDKPMLRRRLVRMLDVALGLNIGVGETSGMARQDASLLDILIRQFATRLLAETRRGLPRAYLEHEEDLPSLRGRLDVVRQFTVHAVRPDRLACRYDALSPDIALMQVMKACTVFLGKRARNAETRRVLDELRFVLADISDVHVRSLPWKAIRLDRTNRRWQTLLALSELFLKHQWQDTRRDTARDDGIALLFPMNDLFESYVAALVTRALRGTGFSVKAQGGLRHCLADEESGQHLFQTKPDLIVRNNQGHVVQVIDTKWKRLHAQLDNARQGVSQADVYQMMAYGRLYQCGELMLLYPHHVGLGAASFHRSFHIRPETSERLHFASVDIAQDEQSIVGALRQLISPSQKGTNANQTHQHHASAANR